MSCAFSSISTGEIFLPSSSPSKYATRSETCGVASNQCMVNPTKIERGRFRSKYTYHEPPRQARMPTAAVIICTSDIKPRRIHSNGRAIGGSPALVVNIARSYVDDSRQMLKGECPCLWFLLPWRHFHVIYGTGVNCMLEHRRTLQPTWNWFSEHSRVHQNSRSYRQEKFKSQGRALSLCVPFLSCPSPGPYTPDATANFCNIVRTLHEPLQDWSLGHLYRIMMTTRYTLQ